MDCLYFPHYLILVYDTILYPLIPKSDWLPISPYCTFLIQFFEFTCGLKFLTDKIKGAVSHAMCIAWASLVVFLCHFLPSLVYR